MNFAGPIDAKSLTDSPVSLDGASFAFGAKPGFVQHHPSDTHIVVPDAHLLFSGHYVRIGNDLIISDSDQKFVVGNYFKGETRPSLSSADGATLSGQIVDALTGHVHYAQAAGAAPAAAQVIGHVLKMSGSATAIRNGVSIELHIGDAVQKGDVVQTGSDSSIGMTFIDGSAFGMTSNARMVLNEMIYDPNGSSNSSLISLVQGTVTFVAGQTAKNGNMRVETPVATMGIRGTAVLVEIAADNGPTKFSVLVEPDGHTGSYNLYDKATGQLIGTVSQAGQVTFVSVGGIGQPPTAIEQLKTLQDQQQEKALIQQVFQLYFPNYNPDNSNPKSQKFGSSSYNNLAEIIFTTTNNQQQTFLTQIELRFAVTDPLTGITTYQNRIFYNTKAQFSALPVFGNQAFVSTTETFKFMDVVRIDDPDIGNGPFYDIGVPFVAGSAVILSAVSTIGYLTEAFLKPLLHINQTTGQVSFDREQFNFLDDGQTVTFMIRVTATSGPDTGLVTVPVTITGANDAPTIVVGTATVITGDVKEDTAVVSGHVAADGTITFQDVDLTDAHTAEVALTSTASSLPGFTAGTELGHFTIDPVSESATDTNNHGSVSWHFRLDENDPTLQSLAKDQTITQVYTITIRDDNGVPVTQTVTITITGTNDAPVLSADASVHQAIEIPGTTGAPDSTVDTAAGTLTFIDLDLSDTHQASAALHYNGPTPSVVWSGGSYSGIPQATRDALNTAMTALVTENNTDASNQGSVGWEFKLPDHLFDFLADGETLTLIYDVTVTDNNGVSSTQQVTVQVGAANDQPVISVIDAGAAVTEDLAPVANILKDSGSVTFTDTDLTDTHTAHVTYNNDATGAAVSTALATALATALTVPTSALAVGDHDFDWNFALDTNLVQYLADGETITATYTVTVTDNSGETNATSPTRTITVTITGTNDTPVITAVDVDGTVEEDVGSPLPVVQLHDTGSVSFADADTTDHETASVAFVSDVAGSGVTISSDLHIALQSALTLQSSSFASNTGTVNWDFNLDNSLIQYLAEGETVTATYTINVKDDSGVGATDTSAAQMVTVVITGTNDAPTVAAVTTPALVDTSAADSFANISGTLVGTDVDNGETAGLTYTALDGVNGVNTAVVGQYGALTVNSDGSYSYVPDAAAINALHAGGYTDSFTVQTTDEHGATGEATFTVNITGANDAPTVAAALTLTATEGDAPVVRDLLAGAADIDSSETSTLSVTNIWYSVDEGLQTQTAPGGITFPDEHTINVAATDPAFDHLAAGETQEIVVSYDVTDAHGATVEQTETITITGLNDRPVLVAGTNLTPVTEDDTANAGQLVGSFATGISDTDDGAIQGIAITGYTNSNGHWEYSLDGGGNWTAFDLYSPASGLLLASDDRVRFIPNGENGGTSTLTYVAWDQTSLATHGQTTNTALAEHWAPFSENSQTASLHVTDVNDAPVLDVMSHYVTETFNQTGPTPIYTSTIRNLIASDVDGDALESFTLTATAQHGTLSLAGSGSGLVDSNGAPGSLTVSGLLGSLNAALAEGITYTSGLMDANVERVTAVLTDSHGAFDTVNFIFPQNGSTAATLNGTSGRDIISSNYGSDTLTGGAGNDIFVFKGMLGNDTIQDFNHGEDLIALAGSGFADFAALYANTTEVGGNSVIANPLMGSGSIILTGVEKAQLAASDFHFIV